VKQKAPRIVTDSRRTVITHREVIGEVVSTDAYTVNEYVINPGEASVFPWLEPQSQSWEYYRFRKCEIHYEPMVSVQKNGQVLMAMEYSSGSPPPPDLKTLMSYHRAVNAPVYRPVSMSLDIGAAFPAGGYKYIRHNNSSASGERKLYDAGVLMVATQGGDGTSGGILSIEFVIEFKTPQVIKPLAPADGLYAGSKTGTQDFVDGTDAATNYAGYVSWPGLAVSAINTIEGIDRAPTAGNGERYLLPAGTYDLRSQLRLISNVTNAAPGFEHVSAEIGTYDPDTNQFAPLQDDILGEATDVTNTGYDRYHTLTPSGLAFFENPVWIAVRVIAGYAAATAAGAMSILTGSHLNIKQLSSYSGP
jgi:hypothetical protein